MNKKFYAVSIFLFVFIVVVLRGFSSLNPGQGSGSSQQPPPMEFKKWQIGRSDEGTDVNNKEHHSLDAAA